MRRSRYFLASFVSLIFLPTCTQRDSRALASGSSARRPPARTRRSTPGMRSLTATLTITSASSPSDATFEGFHQYDAQLEDYSGATVQKEIAALHEWEKRVEAFNPKGLDETNTADRDLLLGSIRSQLLSLETIREWEKNPDNYSSGVTQSAFYLMMRKFAPPDERLRSLVAREKRMPAVFAAARQNLKNPPQVYTEVALEQIPGIVSFFQHDVPSAFTDASDAATKAEFAQTNAAVIADLQSYADWLKSDLLPRSNGDFRIGADTFSKKLLYDEMVDTPLDRLLEIDRANMKRNQDEFKRIAHELEPTKTSAEVLAELEADHPRPDQLLQAFRDTFDSLVGFIKQKHIITPPVGRPPDLKSRKRQPFGRARLTFASMDTPGPFEKVAKEAYFNVLMTLPDAERDAR